MTEPLRDDTRGAAAPPTASSAEIRAGVVEPCAQ